MDRTRDLTAEKIVNHWKEDQIGKIIREYGEEKSWRKISRAIVEERKKKKFKSTKELAQLIERIIPRRGKIHQATLVFQALRIAVNDELKALEECLSKAIDFLSKGGRIAVISFHRLEDRIVKEIFRNKKQQNVIRWMSKKPIGPTLLEIRQNPRCRSAKLRVAEKL